MTSYLYYVQDDQGREIVSAHVDVEKVSDISAKHSDGIVTLAFEDLDIKSGRYDGDGNLTFYRVPSDDKLAKPVSHPIQ